jgi:hypothetical protein
MADQAKAKMPSPDDVQNNQSIPTVTNAKARVLFICNWKNCTEIQRNIEEFASDESPWKGPLFRIDKTKSGTKRTLLRAIY